MCSFPQRGLYRDLSRALLMHRHGAVASGFLVCLSGILFVQLCRCDSFTPRGAVREIGDGLCGALLLSLRHLSTEPRLRGSPLAAGLITANRVVYTNIVCAIPVRSLVATSIGCAAVCVRAGIACVSVGMPGLCRAFFICADGKKTALVHNSLPHDNVLSQGGEPLAVEGVGQFC